MGDTPEINEKYYKKFDFFYRRTAFRSMTEFYAELFSYAPAILSEAIRYSDQYERFKLAIKFAFSIVHNLQMQDVANKTPIAPLIGETYEGLYVMPDGNVDIFMESDYIERPINSLLDGRTLLKIKKDEVTTYIHIEGPRGRYSTQGALTYHESNRGNNKLVTLAGNLTIKFEGNQGQEQIINIQLPDYVLANYISVGGKPRVALISGNMVLKDDKNSLKSVIMINGL